MIPVIDLMNNQAVHAAAGERKDYKPVQSLLCRSSDPLEIAGAFRDTLGLDEIYVADLDAIRDRHSKRHGDTIGKLVAREKIRVLLDAGISGPESVGRWLDLGIHKAVVGSETLDDWSALRDIPAAFDGSRLVFSLDCRNGKILSKCPELAAMPPAEAFKHLESSGWREIILLDLARVGSGMGIDRSWIVQAQASLPGLTLLAGGGITGPEELKELHSLGISGVLVATALHNGAIGPQHIRALTLSRLLSRK